MSRKFITGIAAVAMMTAGLNVAPAKADEYDTARTLAGITALLLIGKALHDRNDDDRPRTHPQHDSFGHGHQAHGHTHGNNSHWHTHNNGYGANGHGRGVVRLDPRPLPPRVHHAARKSLPRACLTSIETRRDTLKYMRGRCLERNYRWTRDLPSSCRVKLRTQRGDQIGYQATCLKRKGYRLDG